MREGQALKCVQIHWQELVYSPKCCTWKCQHDSLFSEQISIFIEVLGRDKHNGRENKAGSLRERDRALIQVHNVADVGVM